jgi:hypothetical protein
MTVVAHLKVLMFFLQGLTRSCEWAFSPRSIDASGSERRRWAGRDMFLVCGLALRSVDERKDGALQAS